MAELNTWYIGAVLWLYLKPFAPNLSSQKCKITYRVNIFSPLKAERSLQNFLKVSA